MPNFNVVKYPVLIFKFKGEDKRNVEVQSYNLETLPEARLDMLVPKGLRHMREQKVAFRREHFPKAPPAPPTEPQKGEPR